MATEEKNDKNITENFDKVNNYIAPTFNGGSGVGSKSNIEKLAEDYVNSNYTDFTKGSDYASLAKRYNNMGKQAMKDTMGQASARTGGYANSYAIQAGQQAQNSFMEKLEDAARGLYDSQMAEKANKLNVAQGIYDRNYSEFKDNRNFGYSVYRDKTSDAQWKDTMIYNAGQDAKEAESSSLYDYICSGGAYGTYNEYMTKNPGTLLTALEYDSIVQKGTHDYTTKNAPIKDEELESLFGSENFDWNTYDWDGDGKTGKDDTDGEGSPDDYISGSSYGVDYWNRFWSDAQKGYNEDNTKDAQARVADAWAAGVEPNTNDLIAAGYADNAGTLTSEGITAKFKITGLDDTDLELLINKEGFDWNTYDWDGDGLIGEDDTDGENYAGAFINSKLGKEWWEDFYTDTVNGRNYNEVVAMIGNGATMDEIKAEFGIDTEGSTATFETVFGKSEAEIQSLYTRRERETADNAKNELVSDLTNPGSVFDNMDPRISKSGEDVEYFYNIWKGSWGNNLSKDDMDKLVNDVESLFPASLKAYEVYNGVSYCQVMIEDALGKEGPGAAVKYVDAWANYDPYGLGKYLASLPQDNKLITYLFGQQEFSDNNESAAGGPVHRGY